MDIILILEKMVMLFLILAVGFGAGKLGIIDEKANKVLSSMVANIAMPSLVLYSAFMENSTVTKSDAMLGLMLSFAMYLLLMVLAKGVPFLLHTPKKNRGIIEYLTVFSNNGFMGFPVIQAVFGDEALIFAAILSLPVNFLMFSYGTYLMVKSGNGEGRRMNIREFIKPGIVSATLALIFYLLSIKIPNVFVMTLDSVGSMTTPLAMIVLGASLTSVSMKDTFREWRVYIFSLIRLALLPFLVWLILFRFVENWTLLGVLVVTAGMPCATMAVIQANQEEADSKMASGYVFITTLLSVATVPALAYILYSVK